jgi:ligand-binding sensor domain-containing protein
MAFGPTSVARCTLALAIAASAERGAAAAGREGRAAFHAYGEDEGLTSVTVECLLQDRTGFLWVGTQDGLFRFDGLRFVRFGRSEGLPSGRVNVLHETKDGRLYVGTRGGLARVGAGRVIPLGKEVGLPEESIHDQAVTSDDEGTVYVGTPHGLFVGVGDRFRLEASAAKGDPETAVTGLHVDARGTLYFARGPHLFSRRSGARGEPVSWGGGAPVDETIDETITDHEGRLWARTIHELYVREPGAPAFVRDDAGLPPAVSAGRLALDENGELLVPTERGLAWKKEGAWRILGHAEGLPGETAQAALVDREGSLWIGLAGDGLVRRAGRGRFATWGEAEGLSHSVVWSIVRQRAPGASAPGALWVGTLNGLDRIDPETGAIRTWTEKDGLAGDVVYGLAAAQDGSVWAASFTGGVTRLGPELERVRRYAVEGIDTPQLRLHNVFVASTGDVWVGVSKGAARLTGGEGKAFTRVLLDGAPDGAEHDDVFAFAEDARHDVWGVSRYGLQRLTGASPRRFRKSDGLRDDFVSSIAVESDGALLVGYREAEGADVVRVDGDRLTVTRVAKEAGASEKVLFVGLDAARDQWIGTTSGVRFLTPGGADVRYGKSDGLPTEDMDQNAFFADADGTVWLGTSRGLVHARPGVDPPAPPPPVLLTSGFGGDRPLDVAGAGATARLGRAERTVRIAWTALTFIDPQKVRYRYRLRGLDDAFVETDSREARFPGLGRGRYRFEVTAISASGRESAAPAVLAFEVLPAWWERWWAYGLFGVAALAAGWGVLQLRVRSLRQRAVALEAIVGQRTRELGERVEELGRANAELVRSHERADRIFTALAEALPGTVLDGKYELKERLGSGGFGVVFRAVHREMRRDVAVKVFKPTSGNDSADALERFRREAQSACRIHHPNAITVYDSGISAEGVAYLVMELLDGPSLWDARQSGMLTVERCLATLARVCDALACAHENGVIHRDVKPENVVLHRAPDGTTVVKVVDFGIAAVVHDDVGTQRVRLTATHAIMGTPAYLAPERIAGEPYDGRTDVYAVGVMAYELLAARTPFDAGTQVEALVLKLRETPPPMRGTDPAIPQELDRVVLGALARDPAARPSAKELMDSLDALRESLPADFLEQAVRSTNLDEAQTARLGGRAPPEPVTPSEI